jgi:hypothetical protein
MREQDVNAVCNSTASSPGQQSTISTTPALVQCHLQKQQRTWTAQRHTMHLLPLLSSKAATQYLLVDQLQCVPLTMHAQPSATSASSMSRLGSSGNMLALVAQAILYLATGPVALPWSLYAACYCPLKQAPESSSTLVLLAPQTTLLTLPTTLHRQEAGKADMTQPKLPGSALSAIQLLPPLANQCSGFHMPSQPSCLLLPLPCRP